MPSRPTPSDGRDAASASTDERSSSPGADLSPPPPPTRAAENEASAAPKARVPIQANKTLIGLSTAHLLQEGLTRPTLGESAAVSSAKPAPGKGLPPPSVGLPPLSAGRRSSTAPRASSIPSPRRQEAVARRIEATEDVSLAELSPASVSAVDRPAHATDPTEDISLQDVSLARPEVANDTELAAPAPHNAPGKSGRASADLAPGRGSKRWLWALGAAALLLGAGFFVRASRMADDLGKRQQVSVGEPRALDTGASTDSRAAAAGKAPIPVPSAPERTLAPAVNAAPLLPALAPEVDSNPALQAAEPSVGATAAASEHEGAAGIEAAGPDESGAEDLKAVEAADAKAAEAADAKGVGAEDGEELGTEGVEELDSARLAAIKRADGLVSQASALRRRRKFAPARSKYRAALVAYPDHPRALYGLAQVAIQQHDGRQAVQLALELVQTKPDQVSYLVLLGDAYKAAGKLKDAREAWQSAARKGSPVARKRLK